MFVKCTTALYSINHNGHNLAIEKLSARVRRHTTYFTVSLMREPIAMYIIRALDIVKDGAKCCKKSSGDKNQHSIEIQVL